MIEDEVRAAFSRYDAGGIDLNRLRHRITRESAQRRKRRAWERAGAAAAAAIALAVVPLLVNTIGMAPMAGVKAGEPVNILLLGTDEQGHSDGIVLVHLNTARSKVYLYSVPRDSVVDLPNGRPGRLGDLGDGVPQWVTRYHGVSLDAVAKMDVTGLEGMVDSVEGIRVCLERPVSTTIQQPAFSLPMGCQWLSGPDVGNLLRFYEGTPYGAIARDRIIQRVLIGLLAELKKTITNPKALHDLLRAARISVSGDLPVAELAWQLRGLQPSDVVGLTRPSFGTPTSPADEELVLALRNDKLERFVAANTDWVTRTGP